MSFQQGELKFAKFLMLCLAVRMFIKYLYDARRVDDGCICVINDVLVSNIDNCWWSWLRCIFFCDGIKECYLFRSTCRPSTRWLTKLTPNIDFAYPKHLIFANLELNCVLINNSEDHVLSSFDSKCWLSEIRIMQYTLPTLSCFDTNCLQLHVFPWNDEFWVSTYWTWD